MNRHSARRTLLVLSAVFVTEVALAAQDDADPVHASLIAQPGALTPGGTALLGLRLQHAPHWHTYWRNPGDSGLPTKLRFTLPEGYSVDDIDWPTPTRFDVGGLYNFGYTDDTLLPVRLHIPAGATSSDAVTISADASWLMCREECIPGKATLSLTMPATQKDATQAALFAHAAGAMPQTATGPAQARIEGDSVIVTLHGDALPAAGLDAFVEERKLVGYAPPKISAKGNDLELTFPKSDYFTAAPAQLNLLLVHGTSPAWRVTAPLTPP